MPGEGDGQGGQKGGQEDVKVKVGDKEYGANDVQNILTQLSSIQDKEQALSELVNMANGVGMTPQDFSKQGIAALTVVNKLIHDGILDQSGELIKKEPKVDDKDKNDDILNLDDKNTDKKSDPNSVASIIAKALLPISENIEKFGKRMDSIEDTQSGMLRQNYAADIKTKFPLLSDDHISRIFGAAMNDRTKSLMQHAEAMNEMVSAGLTEMEKGFAKKYNLDYEQLNENLLKEQDDKGVPPIPPEGKKISFRPIKNGITPLELANKHLAKVFNQ